MTLVLVGRGMNENINDVIFCLQRLGTTANISG